MNGIEKNIYLRKRRIEAEGRNVVDLDSIGDCTLLCCGTWKGIRDSQGNTIIEPVFDQITHVPGSGFWILELKGQKILRDVTGKQNAEFDCEVIDLKVNESQSTVKTLSNDGVGLYSCSLARMAIPTKFIKTTTSDKGRWLWVLDRNGAFCFYDTQTCELIECPRDTDCCFDNVDDMMIVKIANRVVMLTQTGGVDVNGLRRYALAKGGRLRLFDAVSMKSFVTDVYGHIIN